MRLLLCFLLAATSALADKNENRRNKIPFVADALGNSLPPPSSVPATVGSPVDLLTPDRYEFYTFDESGELVKRLMTLEEIQTIVAAGEENDGLVTFVNENQPTESFNINQPPFTKVHNVVTNVQNVLKAQMEAHKNKPLIQPTLDTPDVSDSWSLILPSIFGNTGVDIVLDKSSAAVTTPETEFIEEVDDYENSLSKEENKQAVSTSSTQMDAKVDLPEQTTITPKVVTTIKVTTSTPKKTLSTTPKKSVLPARVTTSKPLTYTRITNNPTSRPVTKTTTVSSTSKSTKNDAVNISSNEKAEEKVDVQLNTVSSTEKDIFDFKISTYIPVSTVKYVTERTTPKTTYLTSPSATFASTTKKTVLSTSKTSTSQTSAMRPVSTVKTPTYVSNTNKKTVLTTTKSPITKTTSHPLLPASTKLPVVSTSTSRQPATTKAPSTQTTVIKTTTTLLPKFPEVASTIKTLLTSTTKEPIDHKTIVTTSPKPIPAATTLSPAVDIDNEKRNITMPQSISPSAGTLLANPTQEAIDIDKLISENEPTLAGNSSQDDKESDPLDLFDVAQSISQIASDLGGTYQPVPTASNLLDTTKMTDFGLESKENVDMDIPSGSGNETEMKTTTVVDKNDENFVKISTIDPHNKNNIKNPEPGTPVKSNDINMQQHKEAETGSKTSNDIMTIIKNTDENQQQNQEEKSNDKTSNIVLSTIKESDNNKQQGTEKETVKEDSNIITSSINNIDNNRQPDENEANINKTSNVMMSNIKNAEKNKQQGEEEKTVDKTFNNTMSTLKNTDNYNQQIENETTIDKTSNIIMSTTKNIDNKKQQDKDENIDKKNNILNDTAQNNEITTVTIVEQQTTIDPILSGSMDDLLSQVVNQAPSVVESEKKEYATTTTEKIMTSTTPADLSNLETSTKLLKSTVKYTVVPTPKPAQANNANQISDKDKQNSEKPTPKPDSSFVKEKLKPDMVLVNDQTFIQPILSHQGTTLAPVTNTLPELSFEETASTIKFNDFKKKIQKVNIDEEELINQRNNSWKLVPTVSPPKTAKIPIDKIKTDVQNNYDNIENKDIILDFSAENQGFEVTTKDLGEDIARFSELANELAFRYWNVIVDDIDSRRSFVFSPYSTFSMLAMIFMGARGATSGEMNEILKLDDMVTFNPHFTLKNISDSIESSPQSGVAVSAFIRELYSDRNKGKILTFYKERAQHFYNGHVEEINFKLISDIIRRRTNLLVKRYSWGKIPEFMKTNNIVMQAPLAAFTANIFQTDCTGTSVDGRDGEMYFVVSPNVRQRRLVPVPAVVYKKGFLAGYDPVLDATVAALGNTNSVVSTLFLMPGQQGNIVHAEDLERLEHRLLETVPATPAWNRILRTLLPRSGLDLQIPRFYHKSTFNTSLTLKKMGLKDLFDGEHADLGGLNGPSKDLYLSDMVQLNTFVTCGEGVVGEQHHIEEYPESLTVSQRRRARWLNEWNEPRDYQRAFHDPHDISDVLNLPLHLRPRQARVPVRSNQPARLKFDRPFLYFVRHNPSGMILYFGRYNPRLLP